MARKLAITHIRSTKANLDTQATANNLLAGEIYQVTDEAKIAIGIGVGAYTEFLAIHVGTSAPADTTKLWLDTN